MYINIMINKWENAINECAIMRSLKCYYIHLYIYPFTHARTRFKLIVRAFATPPTIQPIVTTVAIYLYIYLYIYSAQYKKRLDITLEHRYNIGTPFNEK